jgi:peptidoglycan hydrolase-like protein with peptidoglycan-binding domain
MRSLTFAKLLGLLFALVLVAAACGDSDDSSESETTEATESDSGSGSGDSDGESTPGLDPEFVELFQTQLAAVGCYDGPIDGIDGPATLAAIQRFQAAQGLTEDGVVGSETENALQTAVDAGVEGCSADGDDQPDDGETGADDGEGAMDGADGPQMAISATSYDQVFVVDVCESSTETTFAITGFTEDGEQFLGVSAEEGVGLISVSGNLELQGEVTSAQVGDSGEFTIEGTFDDATFGDFVLEGSCP